MRSPLYSIPSHTVNWQYVWSASSLLCSDQPWWTMCCSRLSSPFVQSWSSVFVFFTYWDIVEHSGTLQSIQLWCVAGQLSSWWCVRQLHGFPSSTWHWYLTTAGTFSEWEQGSLKMSLRGLWSLYTCFYNNSLTETSLTCALDRTAASSTWWSHCWDSFKLHYNSLFVKRILSLRFGINLDMWQTPRKQHTLSLTQRGQ